MRLNNTLKIARTKFRIRRVRLVIGIILLVLLFSTCLTAFVTLNNAKKSLKAYDSSASLNGRYLVSAYNSKPQFSHSSHPQDLIDLAIKKYNEATVKEKAASKKLGIEYVEDRTLYPLKEYDNGIKDFDMSSPYSEAAIIEYMNQIHEYTKDDLAQITTEYHPLNIFSDSNIRAANEGKIFNLTSGKENIAAIGSYDDLDSLGSYFNGGAIIDDELIKPFFVDNIKINKDEIPVIVSYEIAEQIMGLKSLDNATEENQYQRHIFIRENANSKSYQLCYRNSASMDNISDARSANASSHSKVKYNMPTTACSSATIKSDTRTEDEKNAENQQTLLQKELGTHSAPYQQIIRIRIVGVTPNTQYPSTENNAFDLLRSLISSSISAAIPLIPKNILTQKVDSDLFNNIYAENPYTFYTGSGPESYIAEFHTPEDAQKFIAKYNCTKDICDPDKPFKLTLFGNNSVLIDQFFNNVTNILIGAILAIAALALIILFNIINRILADSQKETAVFRAIGYRKSHITKIYLTYIAIYSLIVYALTLLITTIVPWIINAIFSEKLGLYFSVFFDAKELTPFNFASFEPLTLLIIFPILLIGLIAAAIPLIINSRRNIIKNLRQE